MQISDGEVAVAAAQAGAVVVRGRYGTALTRFDKSPGDFATDADIEAERAVMSVLMAARPDDGRVGEELGDDGPTGARRTWLVDPLCGTLNFAARTPLVAVNVALRIADEIAVAAVADPLADEVFWTDGTHARVRRHGRDTALVPSPRTRLVDVNLDAPHPNAQRFTVARMLASTDFTAAFGPRVMSTTLALTWVADGRRAGYVTDGHLRDSVHFASGIALCQAAGCIVTNLRGESLHTGVGGLVAAADREVLAVLLDEIDRQFSRA